MTRRERHLNILKSFGLDSQTVRYHRDRMIDRKLTAFTDEAIEQLVRDVLGSYRRQQKYSAEARARSTA